MLEKRGGGGLQALDFLPALAEFLEERGEDQRAGVVIGAIPVIEPRHGVDGVLENPGGIAHSKEVSKAPRREAFSGGARIWGAPARAAADLEKLARLLENPRVGPADLRPNHFAPGEVGLFPHRVEAWLVLENPQHRRGDRLRVAEWHQLAAAVAQEFGGVPIRRRDHGLSRAEAVGESARGDLRFVQVGREVDVRRADELAQLRRLHIAVHEHDIFLHPEFAGEVLERMPVALAFASQEVRMRGAEDDVNHLGMLHGDARKGTDAVFDALAGREQAEGQQNRPPGHAELVLVKIRIDEGDVRNAVRDDGDFFL